MTPSNVSPVVIKRQSAIISLRARITCASTPRASSQRASQKPGFEGKRNPRDRAAGPDRLIPPAMQHGKQPFWAGLQLLARLTLNPRNDAANQPARLA